MLTIDDQRARAALISARAAFESGATIWGKGSYELCIAGRIFVRPQRCMIGEIGAQLGVLFHLSPARDKSTDGYVLWQSIRGWLGLRFPPLVCPEEFNDNAGYDAVMQFLTDCIDELDRALIEAAAPAPEVVLA